jgi:hypothetical protein
MYLLSALDASSDAAVNELQQLWMCFAYLHALQVPLPGVGPSSQVRQQLAG